MKINFYLDRRSSKDGEKAIYCYVREYNDTLAIHTGQRINPKLWDATQQRGNPRLTRNTIIKGELESLNEYLTTFDLKLREIERNVRKKQLNAKFAVVADTIRKQFDRKKEGFFDIYEEFLKIKRANVSKEAIIKLSRVKVLLEDFQKANREHLDLEKLDNLFLEKFFSFLIERKNMLNNTAQKNIQFLKTFIIWAIKKGHTDNAGYKDFKTQFEENEVIYLTEAELMKLYNSQIDNERLARVRDVFVFQCFTGVRFSDVQNISRTDIKNATWTVRTQKTRQIIQIPLNSYAISVLAKYNDFPQPLPLISNQKMNSYLKELCEKIGIDEEVKTVKYKGSERIETVKKKFEVVGTHTARRTFVSLSLQKGMKPDVIMAITGHTTYRMMQKYLKIADEHKREEMDKTWGPAIRQVK